jgi:mannose-6-phosphate isomerase-like protein (cupin superfamily)
LVLTALCLGGRTVSAQTTAVTYSSWPIGFYSNLTVGQGSNIYGSFAGLDGSDARGGFSTVRYAFPNGWFVGGGTGGMGFGMSGINQASAFGSSLTPKARRSATNSRTHRSRSMPGSTQLNTTPALAARLRRSTPRPAPCPDIARMWASNSSRCRISACRSGSATPKRRRASTATSIRSGCPALRRSVAADARDGASGHAGRITGLCCEGMPEQSPTERTMTYEAINFAGKFTLFDEQWQPKVVAEMNDYQFKIVKLQGDFIWHDHKDTDETFIVLEGVLRIDFRDGAVRVGPGEMFVVPKGVEHKPYAEHEVKLLLIEPRGVVNTGHEGGGRTAENDVWI